MADISSNFPSPLLYQWFPKCNPRSPRDPWLRVCNGYF